MDASSPAAVPTPDSRLPTPPPHGDRCPAAGCGGRVGVTSTYVAGSHRVRYLGCRRCRCPQARSKVSLPIALAPPR